MNYEPPLFTWVNPCKQCPSHWYPPDPEARMVLSWGKCEAEKHAFSCAWRRGGYCMGYMWNIYEEFGNKKD